MLRRSFSTPARATPAEVADLMAREAEALAHEAGGTVAAAGVAFAGPVDSDRGRVVGSPNLALFQDVPFQDLLTERLRVPTVVENDARAATLAEHRLGAGRGARHMVFITVSTGIGGGIVCGGRLYRGTNGAAGEIGHMTLDADGPACGCGNRGCWEAFSSGTAIARDAVSRLRQGEASLLEEMAGGDPGSVTARMVTEAAAKGDRVAREVLDKAIKYLGIGLANVVNIFNPQVIVLGGGLTFAGDLLLEPAFSIARERALRLPIGAVEFRRAAFGDDSGLRGALLLARRRRARG